MAETTPLGGSHRPRPPTSKILGPCEPDYQVHFNVVVRRRPDAPKLPDLSDWQRIPWRERSVISPQEYREKYGATQADIRKVSDYLGQNGMRIVEENFGTRVVSAIATVPQVHRAFKVQLNQYETNFRLQRRAYPSSTACKHHGFDGQVHIPKALEGIVTAVIGLDNRSTPHGAPAVDPTSSSGIAAQSITVSKAVELYKFPTTDASDQTIGLISCTGGYLQSDINKFFTGKTAPTLTDISLFADGQTFSNANSQINTITSSNFNNFSPQIETTCDIQVAGTVAPGCSINVYFTDNTEMGWHTFLNRLLQPASEKQPTMVSCSWTLELWDDNAERSGTATTGLTNFQVLSDQFNALAGQGVNVFADTGDWGADDIAGSSSTDPHFKPDKKAHVGYPSTDPYVTAVGGTIIVEDATNSKGFVEYAWSDMVSGNFPGASGGGCSTLFGTTPPPYQVAAGITSRQSQDSSGNHNTVSGRFTPDISGMVAYSGFVLNNGNWGFNGTSFSTPLSAGLFAVLRSSFGRSFVDLNSLLYPLGNLIDSPFNNVTVGDNDSGRGAPFFSAADTTGTGGTFDLVTGWGSINGRQMQDKLASVLYPQSLYFAIAKNSFSKAEVGSGASFPEAFWLVLEGVAASANVGTPVVDCPLFSSTSGISVTIGPRQLESKLDLNVPQRILYPCTVTFSNPPADIFPAPGLDPVASTMSGQVTITPSSGAEVNLSCMGSVEFVGAADPYFANVAPDGNTPWYFSEDLRVFTVTPGINENPINSPGAPQLNPASATSLDAAAGYSYCQQLVTWLTNEFGNPSGPDPFTLLPNQSNALTAASSVTPTSFDSSTGKSDINYNFAVARVRTNQSTGSNAVKIFFRLFATQSTDTDYDTTTTYPTVSGEPTAGTGNSTIPFFATGNYGSNNDYSTQSVNNKPITGSSATWTYFGCFLDYNDPGNKVGGKAIQSFLPSGHHCLVAEISYQDTPIVSVGGLLASPANSDKLAQRNLEVIYADNPGGPETHLVPQIFDLRPTSSAALQGSDGSDGVVEGWPDELQIEWGNTEPGSTASIYWPSIDPAEVIKLSKTLYATHQLSVSKTEPNTITCTVPPAGFTYIPIPTNPENIAGLLTVQLPQGIVHGQEFLITMRRLRTRELPSITKPRIKSLGKSATRTTNNDSLRPNTAWRNVTGSFAIQIPVSYPGEMLPVERDIQSIMAWRLNQMQPDDRWYKVLQRYLGYVNDRVKGLAGKDLPIVPSPLGAPRTGGQCVQGPDSGNGGDCSCVCHWHRRRHGKPCGRCGCWKEQAEPAECGCPCHRHHRGLGCNECQCD